MDFKLHLLQTVRLLPYPAPVLNFLPKSKLNSVHAGLGNAGLSLHLSVKVHCGFLRLKLSRSRVAAHVLSLLPFNTHEM